MEEKILWLAEGLLTMVCKGVVLFIKTLDAVARFIANVLRFVIILLAALILLCLIESLPILWQSLFWNSLLYGGALTFVCVIALRVWKPEKFSKVFKKLN